MLSPCLWLFVVLQIIKLFTANDLNAVFCWLSSCLIPTAVSESCVVPMAKWSTHIPTFNVLFKLPTERWAHGDIPRCSRWPARSWACRSDMRCLGLWVQLGLRAWPCSYLPAGLVSAYFLFITHINPLVTCCFHSATSTKPVLFYLKSILNLCCIYVAVRVCRGLSKDA